MIKLTLLEDGNPIWIAPWHIVQVFAAGKDGGTTLHLVGQIQTHVREAPDSVAGMVRFERATTLMKRPSKQLINEIGRALGYAVASQRQHDAHVTDYRLWKWTIEALDAVLDGVPPAPVRPSRVPTINHGDKQRKKVQ